MLRFCIVFIWISLFVEFYLFFLSFCSLWSCRWKTACSPTPMFSLRQSLWTVFLQWHAQLRHMREKFWPSMHTTKPRPRINASVRYFPIKHTFTGHAAHLDKFSFFILNAYVFSFYKQLVYLLLVDYFNILRVGLLTWCNVCGSDLKVRSLWRFWLVKGWWVTSCTSFRVLC